MEVRPIIVTDVLGLPKANPQDASSLTASVQSFLNNVVMVTGGSQGPSADELRSSVAAAIDIRPAAGDAAGPMPGSSAFASTPIVLLPLGTSVKPSTSTSDLAVGGTEGLAARPPSSAIAASSGAGGGAEALATAADAAAVLTVLQRDAFLVFRALCKLSIRTNDSASNDPTAIRWVGGWGTAHA